MCDFTTAIIDKETHRSILLRESGISKRDNLAGAVQPAAPGRFKFMTLVPVS